ncbi:unnamed protein product [Arctogadus glacialis]
MASGEAAPVAPATHLALNRLHRFRMRGGRRPRPPKSLKHRSRASNMVTSYGRSMVEARAATPSSERAVLRWALCVSLLSLDMDHPSHG